MHDVTDRFVDDTGRRWPKLSPIATGPRGRCPRCGEGRLFRGFLSLRARCDICGLDYSKADPADGPAVFVQLFACVPGVVFVLLLVILVDPPLWVVAALGLPVLVATTVLPTRPIKGWLVASQFVHGAGEGRVR